MVSLMAACGGGASGPATTPTPSDEQIPSLDQALVTQNVQVFSAKNTGSSVSLISEQLALGSLDRTGAVDQTYSGHANGAVYEILTLLEDMPLSGTLQSQTGATAAIQDDTSQYALYDGTVNVTFSNSKVSATLSDFRGTGQTSGGASESYEKGELDLSIHLTNAALSGECGQSQFCGGSVSMSGNAAQNKTPSSNATVDAKGAFFGPQANEVGGVIFVEDAGRLSVQASFVGK